MPTYTISTPNGEYEVTSDKELTDAEAYQHAVGASKPKPRSPVTPQTYDPAEGMSWGEKALVGAGGGLRRMYLGAKDLVGQGTPDEEQELKDWEKSKRNLGVAGALGEMGAEAVVTAPIGGVTNIGGKLLTKAIPYFAKAGKLGGEVVNVGNLTKAAAEGAAIGAIPKPEEGDSRLGNAATGAGFGAALPVVANAVGTIARPLAKAIIPTRGNVEQRSAKVLEKTFGKEHLDVLEGKVRNAPESRLPQTTAAAADDLRAGEVERGARARNIADFGTHEVNVKAQTWSNILDDTSNAANAARLGDEAVAADRAARRALNAHRVDDGGRNVLKDEINTAAKGPEFVAGSREKRAVDNVIAALDNQNLSAGGLRSLHDSLDKYAGHDGVDRVRESLRYVGDSITDDAFSKVDDVVKTTAKAAEQAKAAQAVQHAFKDERGVVRGTPFKVGGEDIPNVTGDDLREVLRRQGAKLDPQTHYDLANVIEELRKHEIYKPMTNTGGTTLDWSSPESKAAAAAVGSVIPGWRARGTVMSGLNMLTKGVDTRAQKMVDEAMADPKKFLALMDAKHLRNERLNPAEQSVMEMLKSKAMGGWPPDPKQTAEEWLLRMPGRVAASEQGE